MLRLGHNHPVSTKGYTLMELMVTIAIAGIIMAIAAPSYRLYVQNQRAVNLANDFVSALQMARSEAVKRGVPVSVCPASDDALNDCAGSNDWTNGWLVFEDSDGNGEVADDADRIKVHEALNNGDQITGVNTVVTYAATGFLNAGQGDYTTTADGCEGDHARLISLSGAGRVSISRASCD